MSVAAVLAKYTVADILGDAPRKIVEIDSKMEVHAALKKLVDENILSAPVYNEATKQYEGFLDVRDLASFVVFESKELAASKVPAGEEYIQELVNVGARMYKQPLVGITTSYLARRHPFMGCRPTDSVQKIVHVMAGHAHRVVVLNDEGRGTCVVSQSNVVRFLHQHAEELTDLFATKINSPRVIGCFPVLSVHESAPIMDAFKLMSRLNKMGIAVVDDDGKFVGNTSGSDLKLFVNEPATALQQGTMDFLCKIRQQNLKAVHPAIHVKPDETLGNLIAKIVAVKIHRMYAADAAGKLTQVTSLSDIVKYVDWMCL